MTWNLQHLRRRLTWFAALISLVAATTQNALAERPPASRLLPEDTLAVVTVVKAPDVAGRFMNTAIGKMSQDPQLKPLIGQLYGSLSEAVAEVKDRIGLTLPEILAIPQGEVTLALAAAKDAPPAVVVLVDTGNQIANARKLLEKGEAAMVGGGTRKSEEKIGDTQLIVYDNVGAQQGRIAYFEKDGTLAVSNNVDVLKKVLAVWNALWFIDPVGIMKTIGEQNPGMRLAVAMLPSLGLDGLSALGGTVALDAGQFDSIMHVHVLLESPRSGVIKMIALRPGDTKPERWVPADVADYTTLHWDIDTTYKALASVYDSFRGDGALAQEFQQRLMGATGIDFEKEVLPSLEGRMTIIRWFERPVTIRSRATVVALKLKNTDLAGKALDKLAEKFPERIAKKTYGGKTYYQLQIPSPPNVPEGRRPPVPCFGILDDCLVIADRTSFYEKVVATLVEGAKSLADELDYKLVASKIDRQNGDVKPAMVSFNRPEEAMRFLYDLATSDRVQQQLARGAENNRFFKSIDSAMKQNPLPPFAVLQRYLAPGGAMLVDDETGIHYMAFSLRRKTE